MNTNQIGQRVSFGRAGIVVFLLAASFPLAAWAADGGLVGGETGNVPARMLLLMIQLGVIFIAARLGGAFFDRLRLPSALGELSAGILIGPFALGALPMPGFAAGLFPVFQPESPISPELYGLCTLASLILLFMAGLETDLRLLLRYSLSGSLVGACGVIVSFLAGSGVTVLFSESLFGEARGVLDKEPLFLGVIATATSVGITARVLSERRKIASPEGVTILSGAVINDVIGIIMLAIVIGIIRAPSGPVVEWEQIGGVAVRAFGIWIGATAIGIAFARQIGAGLKAFKDHLAIAIAALALALILGGLLEKAGLAMIIGAYIMGLSLSRTDVSRLIQERLHPIYSALVPVFFAVMGMQVDVTRFFVPAVLGFGLLYTLVSALAKIVGCGLPALLSGFTPIGALRIGAGMLPRGEVALILAGVGLSGRLISGDVFGICVLMMLLTTLLGSMLIVKLFSVPARGIRSTAGATEEREPLVFTFPSVQTVGLLIEKLFDAFRADGFFVHTLDREERLYQLRKDKTIIGFREEGSIIVFDCAPEHVAFVNTAVYEVLVELEATIRELRHPVDRKAIGRRLQQRTAGAQIEGSLGDYLKPDAMLPAMKSITKEGAIDELISLLEDRGYLEDKDAARRAVLEREEVMSTGMQYGIAIPHGRTDIVDRLVAAVGISREGIDFDAMDGEPTLIVVLTLSPLRAAAPHMQFMSMVSQAFDEEGRAALLACKTGDEMFNVLSGRRTTRAASSGRRRDRRGAMTLADYLTQNTVTCDLKGATTEEVFNELLDLAEADGHLHDRQAALRALIEREERMPTSIENGVAVPHARTNAVSGLVCALGIHKRGLDFGACDGRLSHVIVMMLSPPDMKLPQVVVMALISRLLNREGRDAIMAADSSEALWALILERSVELS